MHRLLLPCVVLGSLVIHGLLAYALIDKSRKTVFSLPNGGQKVFINFASKQEIQQIAIQSNQQHTPKPNKPKSKPKSKSKLRKIKNSPLPKRSTKKPKKQFPIAKTKKKSSTKPTIVETMAQDPPPLKTKK